MLMKACSPQLKDSYDTWYDEVRADSAETCETYVKKCEWLCQVGTEEKLYYPILVDALLHSLPLFESAHMGLFNRLIEKTKQVMEENAEEFKSYYSYTVSFLMKENSRHLTVSNFYIPCLDAWTDPLRRLDICYTLLKMGDRFPFNCVELDKEDIEHVRGVLLSIGAREVRDAWVEISESKADVPEMERYYSRHYYH